MNGAVVGFWHSGIAWCTSSVQEWVHAPRHLLGMPKIIGLTVLAPSLSMRNP